MQRTQSDAPQQQPGRHEPTRRNERVWYVDAVMSLALIALCLLLGKGVARLFGLLGGLFYVLITGGAGWYYGKAAWRGLIGDRGKY